jgi:hypothetical protein
VLLKLHWFLRSTALVPPADSSELPVRLNDW